MKLRLTAGYRTALCDGTLVPNSEQHMTTEEFSYAKKGDVITLLDKEYVFAVAVYSLKRKEELIYTYCYQNDACWATYTQNLKPTDYAQKDYMFYSDCYFRVCVKRKDDAVITSADIEKAEEIVGVTGFEPATSSQVSGERTECFRKEITDTVSKLRGLREKCPESLLFGALTDTHYAVNGTWEDSANNIKAVAEEISYDGILHLGDLSDGMVSKERTARYAGRVLDNLRSTGAPVYFVMGNHDHNYFYNQDRVYSKEECLAVYGHSIPEQKELYYYKDIEYPKVAGEKGSLRLIALTCFDNSRLFRYGYSDEELDWLAEVLSGTPSGSKVLILSHDAPIARMDYWSNHIHNGEKLLGILERANAREDLQIVAVLSGHAHCDFLYTKCSFPMIEINCNKCEYFLDKKPEGATVPKRVPGEVSQDSWDSMLIDFAGQEIHLVRFGAGEDRLVSFAKKENEFMKERKMRRNGERMQIWAHRGASGYAPENTLPAFELALRMGADGIELDTQLTKDGEVVVCHDERIDRTSDGKGFLRDYTLAELREFNFAPGMPRYGKVTIPTFEEVLILLKEYAEDNSFDPFADRVVLNVELKNSICAYEGMEEKVLALVEKYELQERVLYSSFNHNSMMKIKELCQDARVAFLYSDAPIKPWEYAKEHGAYALHPTCMGATVKETIKEAHSLGIKIHAWTVNEPADIERLRQFGADAIITNYPDRAMDGV